MADALEYAHRHGVVHRDVKPENVLLQSGHALVADFGIALALEHAGGDRLTHTGITLGTPQYMAPEQAAGGRDVDARTDVYALGAVLHEMLAGESPFAAESQHAVLRRMMNEAPTALASRRADVSSFLDAAVRRALEKRPDDRFPSAATFAAALALSAASTDSRPGAANDASAVAARDDAARDSHAAPRRGRQISARAAMYAAGAMLALGLAGGWVLARSSVADRLTGAKAGAASGAVLAPIDVGDMRRLTVGRVATPEIAMLSVVDRSGTPAAHDRRGSSVDAALLAGRAPRGVRRVRRRPPHERPLGDGSGRGHDEAAHRRRRRQQRSAVEPRRHDDRLLGRRSRREGRADAARRRERATRRRDSAMGHSSRATGCAMAARCSSPRRQAPTSTTSSCSRPTDRRRVAYAATAAEETAARISPDGRWVAYTSDESGRAEVYLDSFERPGRPVVVSLSGGMHPVWRGDGRELYYWNEQALVAVRLGASRDDAPPAVETRTLLFRAPYRGGVSTMYDVSPDGERFVIVRARETPKY